MPHRYKVREIAQQSGLSEATVDRVLNERPGVRENTRAEVMQAIADLDKQRAQLRLVGRRYLIDVVMQTPQRFSDAFRAAVEAELPAFAPAMVRARFHLWESGSTAQMVDALGESARQPRRGAQGAGRTRGGRGRRPARRGRRTGGDLRDRRAGQFALRLRRHRQPWSGGDGRISDEPVAGARVVGCVDHAVPHGVRGEGEREVGFRSALRASGRAIVEVSDSDGIDATNERLVLEALETHPNRGGVLRRRRQYGHGRRVRSTRAGVPSLHRP